MRLKVLPLVVVAFLLGSTLSLVSQSINGSGVRFNGIAQGLKLAGPLTLTAGQILAANGTICAAPAYSFSSNTFDGFAWVSAGNIVYCSNGTTTMRFGVNTGLALGSTGNLSFTSTTNPSGTVDTTISRGAAGVVNIGTAVGNALGTLNAAAYQVAGVAGVGFAATHALPANQTGNATATLKMNGLGAAAAPCTITPTSTGRILFTITGDMANNTLADGVSYNMVWGQGIAPANAGPAAGAIITASRVFTQAVGGELTPFTLLAMTTASLTLNLPVWYDIQIADLTGGTASVSNIDCTAHEL